MNEFLLSFLCFSTFYGLEAAQPPNLFYVPPRENLTIFSNFLLLLSFVISLRMVNLKKIEPVCGIIIVLTIAQRERRFGFGFIWL